MDSTATLGVNLSCAAQCPHLGLGTYLEVVEWWGRLNLGSPHVITPASDEVSGEVLGAAPPLSCDKFGVRETW